jgi:ATP-dependent Lhr-like helicase
MNSAADYIIDYLRKIKSSGTVLLFANTRDEAEYLGTILKKQHEIPVEVHHGSLSREMREETEHRLRSGISGIVVCTSSLELGLDIGSVDLVIHYGSPKQVSKLVQRIGRSRHNSTNSAKGIIIVNKLDDELESIAILKRMRTHSVENQRPHYQPLDVLAHHIVGIALSSKGSHNSSDAFKILTKSYPFKGTSYSDFLECINLLESNKLIICNQDKSEFSRRIKSYKYYFDNVSTIPYVLKFDVIDILRKRKIGSLDQQFVGEYGERGNVFVLKGNQWRIINVDDTKMQVSVEQILGSQINVPHWVGEMIPVDVKTAIEVGKLRHKATSPNCTFISDHSKSLENLKTIPDGNNIVVERVNRFNSIVIHSTFGNKVNNTLSSLFSTIISSQIGYLIETKADPYRISLTSVARIGKKLIENVFTDNYDLESILIASFHGTYNLNWKVWNVAKKFGIVNKEAIYDKKIARLIYDRYSKTPLSKESIRELIHDKFDIQFTKKLLDKVRLGEIALHWIEEQEFSPLAEPIIQHQTGSSHSPINIEQGVIDLVKERLLKTKHRLICIRCGKWERLLETREVGETISCKVCGSRLITATFASDYDLTKIIIQKLGGFKITSEENHKFDRAWKAASLINNFGKQAILVMSGYGIGVDTAARILRNNTDSEQIFRTIYDAERQYIMTRGFWKNE